MRYILQIVCTVKLQLSQNCTVDSNNKNFLINSFILLPRFLVFFLESEQFVVSYVHILYLQIIVEA